MDTGKFILDATCGSRSILIFKWSEDSVTVRDVLKLVKLEPLFGHKSGARSRTHWICFLKAVAIE
jgi:hypothetical protein